VFTSPDHVVFLGLVSMDGLMPNCVHNYYVLDAAQLPIVREVRDKFVNTANPPASTAVEVKRLFREGFLIEVEAIAAVPE